MGLLSGLFAPKQGGTAVGNFFRDILGTPHPGASGAIDPEPWLGGTATGTGSVTQVNTGLGGLFKSLTGSISGILNQLPETIGSVNKIADQGIQVRTSSGIKWETILGIGVIAGILIYFFTRKKKRRR